MRAKADIFSTNSASPTINISGKDILEVGGSWATVDLAKNSEWLGQFFMSGGFIQGGLTVNGGHGSTFVNENAAGLVQDLGSIVFGTGAFATINANVTGTGQFSAEDGGRITFNGSVSAGQTVGLNHNDNFVVGPQDDAPGVVEISNWKTFQGLVQLGKGEVLLDRVKNAKTYAYDAKDDLLSIWGNGKNPIATLRLESVQVNGDPPGLQHFSIASTASGVAVYTASDVPSPGTELGFKYN
jgi:hypothetical protein